MNMVKKRVFGCLMVSTAVFLCIPTMAGGYSARSELKVNIIGLRPCPGELGLAEELLLEQEPDQGQKDELPKATPSDVSKLIATKSDASQSDGIKTSGSLMKIRSQENQRLASRSNAGR